MEIALEKLTSSQFFGIIGAHSEFGCRGNIHSYLRNAIDSRKVMPEVNWEAEHLRGTAFYSVGKAPADIYQLWERVRRQQPDQTQNRIAEGMQTAVGDFGGHQIQCDLRPDRVDWIWHPAFPQPPAVPARLISIGPFESRLSYFRDLCDEWLKQSSDITRIAFGAALVIESGSLFEANQQLNMFLPSVDVDAGQVADFLYQVNRRRPIELGAGGIANRLSKWSTLDGGTVDIAKDIDDVPQVHISGRAITKLELDINTAYINDSPTGGQDAVALFQWLVDLGSEITKKGDIT